MENTRETKYFYKPLSKMYNTLADKTRKDFPLFSDHLKEKKPLIYLDHAATSQKPIQVLDSLAEYYKFNNANVHRGAHQLSTRATEKFEASRQITADFINAKSAKEIIFTRNATEAINLVARTWGEKELIEGDEIILSLMEHHSNIVPWQQLAERKGCVIRYINITKLGELDLNHLKEQISQRTRLISLVHISNTLGCCNPIEEVVNIARNSGSLVLLDACQSLAHQTINVRNLDIDFLAGSSHKLCGPTGVGFLWGKEKILENMPPFLGGGEMIEEVSLDKSSWASLPHKFEAGTPAIGEAIGMGSAMKYLSKIGLNNIYDWEQILINHLYQELKTINGIQILGPEPSINTGRGAIATFFFKDIHANDIAALLDASNICIRSGHHCCQPLHKHYKLRSSARASLSFTTTINEIDIFVNELKSIIKFLRTHS